MAEEQFETTLTSSGYRVVVKVRPDLFYVEQFTAKGATVGERRVRMQPARKGLQPADLRVEKPVPGEAPPVEEPDDEDGAEPLYPPDPDPVPV